MKKGALYFVLIFSVIFFSGCAKKLRRGSSGRQRPEPSNAQGRVPDHVGAIGIR